MNGINVGLMDESEFFREGVRLRLSPHPDFTLTYCLPEQDPLKFVDANSIDVLLLDTDFRGSMGLQFAKTVARNYPNTRVVFTTSHTSDEELFEVIKTGAAAYFDKKSSSEELAATIRRAGRGEYPINDSLYSRPEVARRVLTQFQKMVSLGLVAKELATPLTRREIQILSYVANGNTNKGIADMLGISEQTTKNHVSAILRKLNVNDRAHAVALAVSNQWVAVDQKPSPLTLTP